MTKRNPIPPGIKKQHYNYYRCSCGQPYIADIPGLTTRPQKESFEPDWDTPSAPVVCDESKPSSNATWLALIAIVFCCGAFFAVVALFMCQ